MIEFSEQYDQAVKAILHAESIILTCHRDPDGDAFGSLMGFYHGLIKAKELGLISSEIFITFPEPLEVPDRYKIIDSWEKCVSPSSLENIVYKSVIIAFDIGSKTLLNEMTDWISKAEEFIVIDHHKSNTNFGTINIVDISAASAGVVARKLLTTLSPDLLTPYSASAFYISLVSDTNRFKYSLTDETFQEAKILSKVCEPSAAVITKYLFSSPTFDKTKAVMTLASECATFYKEHKIVLCLVSDQRLNELNLTRDEVKKIIDFYLVQDINLLVFCFISNDELKVSLRTNIDSNISAIELAKILGNGGGHKNAAGFSTQLTPEELIQKIQSNLENFS